MDSKEEQTVEDDTPHTPIVLVSKQSTSVIQSLKLKQCTSYNVFLYPSATPPGPHLADG